MRFDESFYQRRPRLVIFAVSSIVLVLVLILAEFLTRLILPEWAPSHSGRTVFYHYDPTLGWAMRPGQKDVHEHQDFAVTVEVNSHGLRDEEIKPKGDRKRLLVLGDSFGWGYGVELEDRFDSLLDTRLSDWQIVNASVSGYGTDQQYLFLQDQGLALEPDAILLLFYENDFGNNSRGEQYWYFKPHFNLIDGQLSLDKTRVPSSSLNQRFTRLIRGHTYLYGRLHEWLSLRIDIAKVQIALVRNMDTESQKDVVRYPELLESVNEVALESSESFEAYKTSVRYPITYALLQAINEVAIESGIPFLLTSVPFKKAEDRAFLESFAAIENIPYLPLDEPFAATEIRTEFEHDLHWNEAGHALATEEIERFLYQQKLVSAD